MAINKNGQWIQNEFNERFIPGGYTQLEYIENTGSQYIDTGVYPNQVTKWEFDITYVGPYTENGYFGGGYYSMATTSNKFYAPLIINKADYKVRYGYANAWIDTDTYLQLNTRYKCEAILMPGQQKLTINNTIIYNATSNADIPDAQVSIPIFCYQYQNSRLTTYGPKVKLHYLKLYGTSNKLIRYFIPVLHNSDNIAGLYDLINGVFYTNAGTGEFKYILNGIPSEYIQVKYIESAGTQWIDSGVNSKPTLKISADFQFTNTSTTQQRVFGRTCDNGSSTALDFDFYINGSSYWAWGCQNGTGNWQSTNKTKDMDRHILIFNSYENKISLDENFYSTTISTTRTNIDSANIYIFGSNVNSSGAARFSYIKLYSFKIWNEGELIKDFIPVKRKSDSKPGLYDIINNVFYINQGSGNDFSYQEIDNWPIIDYTKIDYITPSEIRTCGVKIYKETNILKANEIWEI